MHPYLHGITSPTADEIFLSTEAIRRVSDVQREPPFGSDDGVDELMLRYRLGGRFDTLVLDGDILRRRPFTCCVCEKKFTPEQWFDKMDQVAPKHVSC